MAPVMAAAPDLALPIESGSHHQTCSAKRRARGSLRFALSTEWHVSQRFRPIIGMNGRRAEA
jgi:hypothetical protein